MLSTSDIVCYIPVYNDKDALTRSMTKAHRMGINALVVDGRFTDFPQINGSDYSTDGTQAFKQVVKCHYFECPPCREQDKFNFALQKAHQLGYKVFIYCGADAYFEADMPEFMLNLQRFYEQYAAEPTQLMVQCEELQPDAKWNNTGMRQPRIILNYWKMEARHLHWAMFAKGSPDTEPLSPINEVVEGIKLYHDNTVRPQERDDLMTEYQNVNVPRERKMFMDKIVPRAFTYLKMFPWRIGIDGSYEQGRREFLKSDSKFSHMIVIDEGYEFTDRIKTQFETILLERNNIMMQLPLITAVWASRTKIGNFTLDPDGKCNTKWPKYPKIQRLYSPDGLEVEKNAILVAPYTAGPIVCMNRRACALIENMGDKLDFLAILMGLGIQLHADARIQV